MAMRNACITAWKHISDPASVPFDEEVVQYAVWQREKCPTTSKIHLQMYAESKKPLTIRQWQKAVGDMTAHVEKRRLPAEKAIKYCQKDESRDEETYHEFGQRFRQGARRDVDDKEKRMAVILSAMLQYPTIKAFIDSDDYDEHRYMFSTNEELLAKMYSREQTRGARKRKRSVWEGRPLYRWQEEVIELCEAPADDRHILWFWSEEGDRGKSKVADYLRLFNNAIHLGGKADSSRFAYNGEPIVVFDISASQQEYISGLYSVAEELKNGCVFSSKYMSCEKDFDPPHVLFVSNVPPPLDAWKANRVIELQVPASNDQCCIKLLH